MLAAAKRRPRNPLFWTRGVAETPGARILAVACGYEDAHDLDHSQTDPGFKLACRILAAIYARI